MRDGLSPLHHSTSLPFIYRNLTPCAFPQLGLGDGGMYTLWAGFMVVSELLMVLVWWKGGAWREKEVEREKAHELKREQQARA